MRRTVGLVGFGMATVMAVGLTAPAAGAAGNSVAAPANAESTQLAGYVGTAPAAATSTTTFTVPALKCTAALAGVWEGAFVISTKGALIGTGVFLTCQKGKAVYFGILQPGGTKTYQTTFTPAVGDSIVVSTSVSATSAKVSLTDVKQKKAGSVTGTGFANLANVDGMVALVNTTTHAQLPVPSFGTISYSAASENGKSLTAGKAVAVDMATAAKLLQIQTGALTGAGNAFTETFKHS